MSHFPPFHARPLDPVDTAAAIALARTCGAHGVYVHNALAAGEGETIGCYGEDGLLGLLWFGPRGNLLALVPQPLEPRLVVAAVLREHWPWRIAMGPPPVIDALAAATSRAALVHRDQVYCGCPPQDAAADRRRRDVRAAVRADRERLMQATLELNQADLHVAPERVDRRWLRDVVESRIADGTTRVIGAPGVPDCKLDLGSEGPAGLMLEGVFTFAPARGRGLATGLVATAIAAAPGPLVCLHVAAGNAPARAAYARAGMRELGRCRLLLLG